MKTALDLPLPNAGLPSEKMPGHWLLARLGKRVLRPGGLEMTGQMLDALAIGASDSVVEFAPGLGVTARLVLAKQPHSYIAIERDEAAAERVRQWFSGGDRRCHVASAAETGLPDRCATAVYGEAMLTMQGGERKSRIVREAARVLRPGGRYGIHELCLAPDDIAPELAREIRGQLSDSIHIGARPLTAPEWRGLLEAEGFSIVTESRLPMALLNPRRMIADEGICGALRIARNLCLDAGARRRVFTMRKVFQKYRNHLAAIMLVGVRNSATGPPSAETAE